MLIICTLFCLSANVGASLQYVNTNTIVARLTFTNDKAYCEASITGKSGTTSITNGSVVLRDNNGSVVKTWSGLSATGSLFTFSKSTSGVSSGKTYSLTVTATVNRNGISETVTKSVTSTY